MKKILAITVIAGMLFTSSTAYAGEAWPWVVGGLAGVALLSSLSHDHHSSSVTNVYHERPTYYSSYPTYTTYPSYSRSYPTYSRARVWVPGYYDCYGYYHGGYYTTQTVYASY